MTFTMFASHKTHYFPKLSALLMKATNYCKAIAPSGTLHQGESFNLHSAYNTVETTPSFTVKQRKSSRDNSYWNWQGKRDKLDLLQAWRQNSWSYLNKRDDVPMCMDFTNYKLWGKNILCVGKVGPVYQHIHQRGKESHKLMSSTSHKKYFLLHCKFHLKTITKRSHVAF